MFLLEEGKKNMEYSGFDNRASLSSYMGASCIIPGVCSEEKPRVKTKTGKRKVWFVKGRKYGELHLQCKNSDVREVDETKRVPREVIREGSGEW